MPVATSTRNQLELLIDRESLSDSDYWLPSDTQLTQWIDTSLVHSMSATPDKNADAGATALEISLSCVTGEQMRHLNAQYRNKDRKTNVLSFPAAMPMIPANDDIHAETHPLGDIVICPEVLLDEASAQNKSLEHHWAHMVVHGVLHLNGLDHEDENAARTMESLEIQILSELGIANPYLAVSARQS